MTKYRIVKRQQEIKKVKEALELLDRNKSYYEMEF